MKIMSIVLNNASLKKILLFSAAIVSIFWFINLGVAVKVAQSSYSRDSFATARELSWLPMAVLMTVIIVFIAFRFYSAKIFSKDWRFYLTWLIVTLTSVIFVSMVYLAARKCGIELFSSRAWAQIWIFTTSLMLPLTITGIMFSYKKANSNISLGVIEIIVTGIVLAWSYYIFTFGITIWNEFSSCTHIVF